MQVLHITGPQNVVRGARTGDPADPPYVVIPYVDEMQYAYAAADFVICRSAGDDVRRTGRCRPAGRYVDDLGCWWPRCRRAAWTRPSPTESSSNDPANQQAVTLTPHDTLIHRP